MSGKNEKNRLPQLFQNVELFKTLCLLSVFSYIQFTEATDLWEVTAVVNLTPDL